MITADTLTTEHLATVWRIGCADGPLGNIATMRAALVALNARGDYTAEEQQAARETCAAILKSRFA